MKEEIIKEFWKGYKKGELLEAEEAEAQIRIALAEQKKELSKKIEKPLEIIEDFIERWNKQDKEREVAQAIQDLKKLLT